MRVDERNRVLFFVVLLALPFCIGYVAGQYTGRPIRVYASAIFLFEVVIYLVFALIDDIAKGRVTAERYGARKTYTRVHSPVGYWSVMVFQSAALILFGWLDWNAIAKLLA